MKWYKKQMDKLKISKSESPVPNTAADAKNNSEQLFDVKKIRGKTISFPNPVAASKLKRAKTDVH